MKVIWSFHSNALQRDYYECVYFDLIFEYSNDNEKIVNNLCINQLFV